LVRGAYGSGGVLRLGISNLINPNKQDPSMLNKEMSGGECRAGPRSSCKKDDGYLHNGTSSTLSGGTGVLPLTICGGGKKEQKKNKGGERDPGGGGKGRTTRAIPPKWRSDEAPSGECNLLGGKEESRRYMAGVCEHHLHRSGGKGVGTRQGDDSLYL